MTPQIETIIIESAERARASRRNGGAGVIALGALLAIAVYFTANGQNASPAAAAIGTFALFVVIGGAFIVSGLVGDPRNGGLVLMLRERAPESIVWLYALRPSRQGAPGSVGVGFDDGKIGSVSVNATDVDVLLDALKQRAPRATEGFSGELMQRFHASPASLRRP